jgi:hypothetical protein
MKSDRFIALYNVVFSKKELYYDLSLVDLELIENRALDHELALLL